MTSKIHSAIPYGFLGKLVEVEGDMNRGLPAFNIVGMANKTINEAKERVRSAIVNSGFSFPDKKRRRYSPITPFDSTISELKI